jgi:hypothetical protein
MESKSLVSDIMTKPHASPHKHHPIRRRLSKTFALASFGAFALTVLACVSFVAGAMLATMQILDGIAAAISSAFESLPRALALLIWEVLSSLIELITFVLMGQWTQFLMRVAQLLGSS